MDKIFIVIPVYNEAENIRECLNRIESEVKIPHIIGIVYDKEEDTTLPVVKEMISADKNLPVILIKNKYGRGALNAIKTGLESSTEKYTVVTMADLSDPPAVINDMYEKAEKENADIVCASRYMKGGSQKGGPFIKSLMSRIAGVSLHLFARVPTYDSTNSFKLYKTSFLQKQKIESTGGFELGLELVAKAYAQKAKIAEVPTSWTDRSAGKSNFKVAAWTPKYLRWYFYAFKGLYANHRFAVLLLIAVILSIPAARCFLFVQQFGLNFMWMDEWELPYFFDQVKQNGLSLNLLFARHNEHRIFFPKLLHLLNMSWFDYNSKIAMYCSYLFLFSGWLVILKYIKGIRQSAFFKIITALLVSVLCFNLRQIENLLWGFQIAWLLIFFCVIASFFLFHKYFETLKESYLAASVALAIIASFSSAQGLFLWISFIFIFFLMLISREKFDWKIFAVVLINALAAFLLYFFSYGKKAFSGNAGVLLYDCFAYCVKAVGNVLYTDYNFTIMAIFSVSVILFSAGSIIYLAVNRKIKENIFPIALMCFGYIFIFSILIGRAKAGIIRPESSRYVTFVQMCYIGLILICFQNIFSSVKKRVFISAAIVIICVFEFSQPYLYGSGRVLYYDRIVSAMTVRDYKTQENIRGRIVGHWWNKEQFVPVIQLVEKNKWNLFSQKESGKDYKKLLKNASVPVDIKITE